jgi:ABC-type transport system involved in multi-copper enzyme maturation permease subunit
VNAPLWRKELREQRFFAFFGLVLVALDFVDVALSQPDANALGHTFARISDGLTWFGSLAAFAIGTGLLAREVDENTLGFLDGLPVSRARIFSVKLGTALAVLMVYPLAHLGLQAGLHLLSRGSLDHDLHASLFLLKLSTLALVVTESLLLGMVFGFTRGLAWGLFAACVVLLKTVSETTPWVESALPASLVEFRLVGDAARISWTALLVHLALTALLLSVSAWLFSRAGRASRLDGFLKRPLISAGVLVGTAGAVLFAISVVLKDRPGESSRRAADKDPDTVRFTPAPSGRATTGHYRFSYPAHRAEPVAALIDGADDAFAAVERLLGLDGGAAIPVDLSGSSNNTEGTALHGTIRMGLDENDLVPVLAHETSHVFAHRAVGKTGDDALSDMAVFDEGLARWVERHFDADGGFTEMDRFEAAVVSRRGLVPAKMLTETDQLYEAQGETLRYVLGDAFVAVLVRRYGPLAPRRVLETLGAHDFPRGLSGQQLWVAAFQLSGFDLPLVLLDWVQLLKRWENEHSDAIALLPRVRAIAWKAKGWAGVQVLADGEWPEGWHPAVRFRPAPDSPLKDYRHEWPKLGEIAWEPTTAVANDQVCFQVGLGAQGVTLYEQWACLPLDGAAEMEE